MTRVTKGEIYSLAQELEFIANEMTDIKCEIADVIQELAQLQSGTRGIFDTLKMHGDQLLRIDHKLAAKFDSR